MMKVYDQMMKVYVRIVKTEQTVAQFYSASPGEDVTLLKSVQLKPVETTFLEEPRLATPIEEALLTMAMTRSDDR
jgi:hypothetical protein